MLIGIVRRSNGKGSASGFSRSFDVCRKAQLRKGRVTPSMDDGIHQSCIPPPTFVLKSSVFKGEQCSALHT
ncbi:hypothetical protein KIN20_015023 [Parelaphostrongylus tenuis]|uniref:Uncharacterized protein n=1 Tax=Parelaphostrongylus tenuis TaxID=148309 RepID=A0AAD5MHX5_PARTN|nr:hypothetical protein KIN20_015023 [Parelaphostrongylus tenuis]